MNLGHAIATSGAQNFNRRSFQFGLVHAVHARASTTLSAGAAAAANSISTAASIAANSLIIVPLTAGGKTGPLLVQSVTGSGPYTVVLSGPLLTSALVNGTPYTSLVMTAIPVPLAAGSQVTLTAIVGGTSQTWTLSSASAAGATTLSVVSQAANAAYGTGSLATPAGGLFPVGRQLPAAASNGATVMTLPTIDAYLDGSQHVPAGGQKISAPPFLTTGIRYLSGYTPTVGHTALILLGGGLRKSDRVAIGRLA